MDTTIYQLKLHAHTRLPGGGVATRVPGGWIYQIPDSENDTEAHTFVPFSEEFAPVAMCHECSGISFRIQGNQPAKCNGCKTELDGKTCTNPPKQQPRFHELISTTF